MDHITNEDITKKEHIKPVETFLENKILFKVVWSLLEARTQPHLCDIAKTRGFWDSVEKEQRPTEREMEGQHTGRHEGIPTD